MKFKKEMFAKFPILFAKYSKQMASVASFPQFDALRELIVPKFGLSNSHPRPTSYDPAIVNSQLSAYDLRDIERVAAILAAAVNMHELLTSDKGDNGEGHHFSMDANSHIYNNYRGFIASMTHSFFEEHQIEELQKGRDAYSIQDACLYDFAMHVLERPLTSFFEEMLFEELKDEEEMAMFDDEWNGFVEFVSAVRTLLSHVYIAADTKTFYGAGFNTRFGSLVSFRNEKRRRMRQQDMAKEIDQLKVGIGAANEQIIQLHSRLSDLVVQFDAGITTMYNRLEAKLNEINTGPKKPKSKKST